MTAATPAPAAEWPAHVKPGVWIDYDAWGGFVGHARVERIDGNGRVYVQMEYKSGKLKPGVCWFERDEVHRLREWSKTSRGGRQLQLLEPEPSGGCMRWGLCDPPTDNEAASREAKP